MIHRPSGPRPLPDRDAHPRGHRAPGIAALLGLLCVHGCEVADPEGLPIQLAIVVTSAPDYEDVVADVDRVELRITPPSGATRDTTLVVNVAPLRFRTRLILRPDEGAPGTTLEATFLGGTGPLFTATTVLDPPHGLLSRAELELIPVADFDLGLDWPIPIGETLTLTDLTPLRFFDGRLRGARDVTWASSDPAVFEVSGDQLASRGSGTAMLIGTWHGQTDTLAIEVLPPGVELKRWNPLCLLGDLVGSPSADGNNACVDLIAKAWPVGSERRVVLELRNRHGSLGGILDTADYFDIFRFGILIEPPLDPTPELLGVTTVGAVGAAFGPTFINESGVGIGVEGTSMTTIIGCGPKLQSGPRYSTCAVGGETGLIRAEFRVVDTNWSLSDAEATLSILMPGIGIGCLSTQPRCSVVPRGGR